MTGSITIRAEVHEVIERDNGVTQTANPFAVGGRMVIVCPDS